MLRSLTNQIRQIWYIKNIGKQIIVSYYEALLLFATCHNSLIRLRWWIELTILLLTFLVGRNIGRHPLIKL